MKWGIYITNPNPWKPLNTLCENTEIWVLGPDKHQTHTRIHPPTHTHTQVHTHGRTHTRALTHTHKHTHRHTLFPAQLLLLCACVCVVNWFVLCLPPISYKLFESVRRSKFEPFINPQHRSLYWLTTEHSFHSPSSVRQNNPTLNLTRSLIYPVAMPNPNLAPFFRTSLSFHPRSLFKPSPLIKYSSLSQSC